jgi:hypothetical protein
VACALVGGTVFGDPRGDRLPALLVQLGVLGVLALASLLVCGHVGAESPPSSGRRRLSMTPDPLPAVYFIEDLCRELRISRRTIERLLRARAFPIPELPALDKRHRWSPGGVERFIQRKVMRQLPGGR